ncbi:hypothetical protein [Kineococcus esterisolvens]|uniref:hypothetical protein n=1 Tax=unclassified Kineococcus TaxID=2621656 RepID=UPI003D7C990E
MRATRWTWTFEDAEGRPLAGGEEVFPTRADAEVWIGQNWRALRDQGAETAHLSADGRGVDGPLSLRPAD